MNLNEKAGPNSGWPCPICKYSLVGEVDRCPECGAPVRLQSDVVERFVLGPRQLAAIVLVVSLSFGLSCVRQFVTEVRIYQGLEVNERRESQLQSAINQFLSWRSRGGEIETSGAVVFNPQAVIEQPFGKVAAEVAQLRPDLVFFPSLLALGYLHVVVTSFLFAGRRVERKVWRWIKAEFFALVGVSLGLQLLWLIY